MNIALILKNNFSLFMTVLILGTLVISAFIDNKAVSLSIGIILGIVACILVVANPVECPQCGADVRLEETYCSSCGAKQDDTDIFGNITCEHCGGRHKKDASFCPKCGEPTNNRATKQ